MTVEVAVTGMAALTTIGATCAELAAALHTGRSGIRVDPDDADGVCATLADFDLRAWAREHAPDQAAELVKVAGRAALPAQTAAAVAVRALDDGKLAEADRVGTAVLIAGNNLALGYHASVWQQYAARPGSVRPSHILTHLDTDVLGVVSELTGAREAGSTVGGASASGNLAVIAGTRLVRSGEVDRVLVVAPAAELSAAEITALRRSGALAVREPHRAPEQTCRPFDRSRRGFVRGQGAAAVLLESKHSAARRGVTGRAVVAGYGQRLDGTRGAAPNVDGQVTALRRALADAGVRPAQVDYVNAHGTGSVAGDPVEADALREVFGGHRPLVNSTKPLTGHCLTAAGVVELVATVLQMEAEFVHGNPTLGALIPGAPALTGPAAVPATLDVAVSHSVAFSGINATVVLRAG